MKSIKTLVTVGLALTLTGATAIRSQANDEPSTPATPSTPSTPTPSKPDAPANPATPDKPATPAAPNLRKPVRQQLAGKVISVDRFARTVTLQVNNLTYVLQITDSTRIDRSEKEKTFADIVVGEEITVNVMLRELANGKVEVAVLSVALADTVAAQGLDKQKEKNPKAKNNPFNNGGTPSNIDGPVVSPNR